MAITGCLATTCDQYDDENAKEIVQARAAINSKHARMMSFVSNAYGLMNKCTEQINWIEKPYESKLLKHIAATKRELSGKKSGAEKTLLQVQESLEDFCPEADPAELEDQMKYDVDKRFETNTRYFVEEMMKERYGTFAIGMPARLYIDIDPPGRSYTPTSNGQEIVERYNFDTYCAAAKERFNVYLKQTNANVQLAQEKVIALVKTNDNLPNTEKAMLEAAVQHQVDQFNIKVEQTKLCERPTDSSTIDVYGQFVRVVAARIKDLVHEMRHSYGQVLMRGLKNVSYRFDI